jgi:hypothetical protein
MRKTNWPAIIAAKIAELQHVTFSWGTHDCCLSVADVVLAFTGIDFAEEYRGAYSTAIGAKRALVKHAGGDVCSAIDSKFTRIELKDVGRGDLVLISTDVGDALGIIFSGSVWAMSEEGFNATPMTTAILAWRVA